MCGNSAVIATCDLVQDLPTSGFGSLPALGDLPTAADPSSAICELTTTFSLMQDLPTSGFGSLPVLGALPCAADPGFGLDVGMRPSLSVEPGMRHIMKSCALL